MYGSPQANVSGGSLLLHLDLWCIERGCLPFNNGFSIAIGGPQEPGPHRAYAASFDAIGVAALIRGL